MYYRWRGELGQGNPANFEKGRPSPYQVRPQDPCRSTVLQWSTSPRGSGKVSLNVHRVKERHKGGVRPQSCSSDSNSRFERTGRTSPA